ncbi:carbohydrate ABC transporter permease [Paenibacillus sp. 598K]|uniref:carbohydrate ABC transporter permease n=1 Tax=Paenibacillus sp. 598K TaxID=1117987 RepID=UPI000FFA4AC9|nr:carbohydrate ABC transporter permease [Paenibacillus sp. 598K]GBF74407.1 carbohydrate ABC transporter permease [Paenibacillus sp. 598K]
MKNGKAGERIFDLGVYSVLILLMAVSVYPLLHVLFASLSDGGEIVRHRGILFRPLGFNLDAYKIVLSNASVMSGYLNTLYIVVIGLFVNLVMTTLGAFVLSRRNVLWNNTFMFVIVFTMFFSGGIIPLYLTVKGVGLIDSLASVVVPFAISTFNLIILRTSFMALPVTLEESAKMDGAGHLTVLLRIVLPLSLPALAVIELYYAVGNWNGWFWASVFIKDSSKFPLQLVLRQILIQNSTDSMLSSTDNAFQVGESIKYATIMVATLPILCVYPFIQRFFVKGVLIGALKG